MDNNKRDYSEFFDGGRDDSFEKEDSARDRQADQDLRNDPGQGRDADNRDQGKSSYYYSYGPFKSMNDETPSTTTSSNDGESSSVEITSPRQIRPYYGYGEHGQHGRQQMPAAQSNSSQWDYSPAKKRFPLKSYFATFLAGAVVVSGLMFASDRMDLFSSSSPAMSSNGGGTAKTAVNGNGGNGGASTAALNDIVRPGNISDIVKQTSGAVVKINTYVSSSKKSQRNGINSDDIFNYFFGNGNNGGNSQKTPTDSTQRQTAGLGSGFIFDKTGYILTNQHVVDGADEIEVEVEGYSKPFKAKLMGSEYSLDLAVLKIEDGKDFPFLPMGSSDDIKVGEWVVAIGNPYGFDHTVTVGVVSAKERPIDIPDSQGTRNYKHLLQTDASINPGNSGGPLINLNGEVIGINTAVSAQAQGIGFAIPTSTVQEVLENLKTGVKMPQPFIGVGLQDIQDEWVKQLKLDNNKGSVITQVESGSPASKAGLTAGDVIIEVNGAAVSNSTEVTTKIKALKADDKVTLKIVRDGKKMDTFVIVGDRNKP